MLHPNVSSGKRFEIDIHPTIQNAMYFCKARKEKGLQIVVKYVQAKAGFTDNKGKNIIVKNSEIMKAKKLIVGFGYKAEWYINFWCPKWHAQFVSIIGGVINVQAHVTDFFNTTHEISMPRGQGQGRQSHSSQGHSSQSHSSQGHSSQSQGHSSHSSQSSQSSHNTFSKRHQHVQQTIHRVTPDQIKEAMKRIWEIGIENKKWDHSVIDRHDLLAQFPTPSFYVLINWMRMQIGDMFRLVGDLVSAETRVVRVVTALMIGATNRASTAKEATSIKELANRGQLLLAQILRRQAQLESNPVIRNEREVALHELYVNLETRAQTKSIQLFAVYQRIKFGLEKSKTPNLASLYNVKKSYEIEIRRLGRGFIRGCEIDIHHQHIQNTIVKWSLKFNSMTFLEGCAAYEHMFEYRRATWGDANRHTIMMAKIYSSHLLLLPQCGYKGRSVMATLTEAYSKLMHANKYVVDEIYRSQEITPLIVKCQQLYIQFGQKSEVL